MLNIDFNNIRPINGLARDGFEEFVCQLARKEEIPYRKRFERNGKPDGGVECYWILENDSEVAWQAKYFSKAFGDSQYQKIDDSVKMIKMFINKEVFLHIWINCHQDKIYIFEIDGSVWFCALIK